MSARAEAMRDEADRLCVAADQLDHEKAWPLYSRALRLRDAAHLMDESAHYQRMARQATDPDERDQYRSLARSAARSPVVQRVNAES